jgi:DNA-binding NarL/FixJ family response regulator
MQLLNVVIAQEDCTRAENLAIALHPHFRNVSIARDVEELIRNTAKNRVALAVVDLELVSLEELADFCKGFPQVAVVCTHRVPDEEMWARSLAAGAIDCCQTVDVRLIVEAAQHHSGKTHAHAA